MMTEKDVYDLAGSICRYIGGSANEADIRRVEEWKKESDKNAILLEKFSGDEFLNDIIAELKLYDSRRAYENFVRKTRSMSLLRRMRTAAAILLPLLAAGSLLILSERDRALTYNPSDNAVVLTLSDNQEIILNNLNASEFRDHGQAFANSGESISYTESESLAQAEIKSAQPIYHTLTVPRGKEYTIILSDGTNVKLNAGSKLKYPVPFADNERRVSITGEAYFKVSRDAGKPFVVETANYDILVTGTEFNVRSYTKDQTATTLVSGAVRIAKNDKTYQMSPGQHAVVADGEIRIDDVKMDSYIAWANGEFLFSQKPLCYIMSEISNWYDIEEVVYDHEEAKGLVFSAGFARSKSLDEILETLEATGSIKVKLTHGKIKVSYKH